MGHGLKKAGYATNRVPADTDQADDEWDLQEFTYIGLAGTGYYKDHPYLLE